MIYEEVIKRNEGLIHSIVNRYSSKLNDKDDLYQECLMKLWNVFNDYDDTYKWTTFITIVCSNHLHNIVKSENGLSKVNRTKDKKMLKDLRLDSKRFNHILGTISNDEPKYTSEETEILDNVYRYLDTYKHKDKIKLILQGKTYREVGEQYGVSKQYIYKLYKEFIKKIKKEYI